MSPPVSMHFGLIYIYHSASKTEGSISYIISFNSHAGFWGLFRPWKDVIVNIFQAGFVLKVFFSWKNSHYAYQLPVPQCPQPMQGRIEGKLKEAWFLEKNSKGFRGKLYIHSDHTNDLLTLRPEEVSLNFFFLKRHNGNTNMWKKSTKTFEI